jgi:hypothetical protein
MIRSSHREFSAEVDKGYDMDTAPTHHGPVDETTVQAFRKDGFVAYDPMIPPDELEYIRSTLMKLHETGAGFAEGAQFDAISATDASGPARFPQILHPRNFAPGLLETSFYKAAQAAARQILGESTRFKADISLLKPARIGSETPWHQDEAFLDPAYDYNEVSFWLALQPTDLSNSCMSFIPGSHLGPVLPHGFPGDDPRVHALECKTGFDPKDAVPFLLPNGSCSLHTNRTLHYAGTNVSDKPRLAYVLLFNTTPVPVSAPRTFPWLDLQTTARAQRELQWRRRGGLFVHLWRQRNRMKLYNIKTLAFDIKRSVSASKRLMSK